MMQPQPWNEQQDFSDSEDGYTPRMDPRGPPRGFMPAYEMPPPGGFIDRMSGPPPPMPPQGICICHIPHYTTLHPILFPH